MKTIIHNGFEEFRAICGNCGCKFTYNIDDISSSSPLSFLSVDSAYPYVICPRCEIPLKHTLPKKEDNIGVSANQTD